EVIDELDLALNSTLTYDFDSVAESLRAAATRARIESSDSAAGGPSNATDAIPPPRAGSVDLAALFRHATPAANMPEGPPRVPEWSPGAGLDRRGASDRRARRTSFLPDTDIRPSGLALPGAARERPEIGERQARIAERQDRTVQRRAESDVQAEAGHRSVSSIPKPLPRARLEPQPRLADEPQPVPEPQQVAVPPWRAIPLDGLPRLPRLEPIRHRRWPWLLLGLIAGGAAAVYFWLPQVDLRALPPDLATLVQPLQAALQSDGAQRQPAPEVTQAEAPAAARAVPED